MPHIILIDPHSTSSRGNEQGRAFRDLEWEAKIHEITQKMGIGAQFGGKYFCHDVRVVRLPRHGASCPVAIGVSCSADRQAKTKITKVLSPYPITLFLYSQSPSKPTSKQGPWHVARTLYGRKAVLAASLMCACGLTSVFPSPPLSLSVPVCLSLPMQDGVFLEQLETDVGKYLPEVDESALAKDVVKVDLNKPMADIRATLSKYPIRTRLSLTGKRAHTTGKQAGSQAGRRGGATPCDVIVCICKRAHRAALCGLE
jgi:hypothetical protein